MDAVNHDIYDDKVGIKTEDLIDAAPPKPHVTAKKAIPKTPLTTKKAIEFLLSKSLNSNVCRYCLNVTSQLNNVGKIMQIAGKREVLYKIAISDMIATVYPYEVTFEPNLPNKICDRCLDHTLKAYLFAQQCEQTERALRNCFEEIYKKFEQLDPIDQLKKRGRKKLLLNHDILYVTHKNVIDYAEPVINLVNRGSGLMNNTIKPVLNNLECPKCWQVMPNQESLINHEKSHPSTMWYHCRLCGNSFAKFLHMKRHLKTCNFIKEPNPDESKKFECLDCGKASENYAQHLQHIEKHKFKKVLDHVMKRKMNDLCSVCLDKGKGMVELDKTVALHGGCPELSGDRSLYSILGSTLPNITRQSLTGNKICKKCFDYTMRAYVFINQTLHIRSRLNKCVTAMLDNLEQIKEPEKSVFIEIADNLILPINDIPAVDDDYYDEEDNASDEDDENKMKVDILEDEFRIKSESEDEIDESTKPKLLKQQSAKTCVAKRKTQIHNGFQSKNITDIDVCSEFLTFKKNRKSKQKRRIIKFTCPICNKQFLNDYFLSQHITKHFTKQSSCNLCDKVFHTKFSWREHYKMDHIRKDDSYITCNECGRAYNDFNRYKLHKKSHLMKQCHICDKTFKNQQFFDSHLQRHALRYKLQKRKVYNCSFCEIGYWSDNKLSLHVNKVHLQVKQYSCNMCEKQFYTEQNLARHKIVHSVGSKEKCEFCDKTLKCRRALVSHLKKHIG